MLLTALLPALLDLVAPRLCAGCDLPSVAALCASCVERLQGEPAAPSGRVGAAPAHAAFLFSGAARRSIVAAKFGDRPEAMRLLAAVAAERLAPALAAASPFPDAVVPVALSHRRRRERGYNQALIAARAIAALPCGGPVVDGLARIRHTRAQVGRGATARGRNVEGAFAWEGPHLRHGARVWLVDDVVTTGATLGAAGAALQRAGPVRIEFVAVGCAP